MQSEQQHQSLESAVETYRVGDLILDTRSRTVQRPDGATVLTARVFDLFIVLLEAPHQVHSRESLFERVWGTTYLDDGNLTQTISVLRKAFGETRKEWIRTIAKKGYAFEPPVPIQRGQAGATVPSTVIPAQSPRLRRQLGWMLIGVLAAACAGSNTIARTAQHKAAAATDASIAMIVTANPSASATSREGIASELLAEWLRWKLGLLPAVDLVEAGEASTGRHSTVYVLDVSVSTQADRDAYSIMMRMRPVYNSEGAATRGFEQRLSYPIRNSDLPDAIDDASRRALAGIFPRRANDPWPRLDIGMDQAAIFLDAVRAEKAHDSLRADALYTRLTERAPRFAPGFWNLARLRSERGDRIEAPKLAHRAQILSAPTPRDSALMLAAAEGGIAFDHPKQTIMTYATLSLANSHRVEFVLERVRLYQRMSRPEEAMRLLANEDWSRYPLSTRIEQLMLRSQLALTLGDLITARESADDVIRLMPHGLQTDPHVLGIAQLVAARAYHQLFRAGPDKPEMYRQAADTLESGGYAQDAAVARFHEAIVMKDTALAERRMQAAIVIMRANDDRLPQIMILRAMAEEYDTAGDTARGDDTRRQARAIAQSLGNRTMQDLLELEQLIVAVERGDIAAASDHVNRLRHNTLWTKYRYRAAIHQAKILGLTGRYREALAVLDEVVHDTRRNEFSETAPDTIELFCERAATLIAIGEYSLARDQVSGCRDIGSDLIPIQAELLLAEIALHNNDRDTARARANAASVMLEKAGIDYEATDVAISLSRIWIKLADPERAERLYRSLDAFTQDAPLVAAQRSLGLAEIAAMRGEWDESRKLIDSIRNLQIDTPWKISSRIEIVEIAGAIARGDARDARKRSEALVERARRTEDAPILQEAVALRELSHRASGSHSSAAPTAADIRKIEWLLRPPH